PRARVRPLGGQYLPGRADARAAVLPASRSGVGAIQDAGEEPLHVRLGDASRRRNHGRAGQKRGDADAEGDQVEHRIQNTEYRRLNRVPTEKPRSSRWPSNQLRAFVTLVSGRRVTPWCSTSTN